MKTVREILSHKGDQVHAIDPDRKVLDALREMARHDVGALVVVEDGRAIGVISERDYARKIVLQGSTSRETPVRQIMTTPARTVTEDDSVDRCLAIMTEHRIRHLPVLRGESLVGVVSIGDLVKAKIAEQGMLIEQLQHYISGEM